MFQQSKVRLAEAHGDIRWSDRGEENMTPACWRYLLGLIATVQLLHLRRHLNLEFAISRAEHQRRALV